MRFFIKRIISVPLLLCAAACSNPIDQDPQRETVIQVDRHALSLKEFNDFFQPVKMNYEKLDDVDLREARLRYLLQLVEEMIILRRAEELNITVPAEELERAASEVIQDYPEDSFDEMLMKQAISLDLWKEQLHRQMLIQKVVEEDLSKNVSVDSQDIQQYYEEHKQQWHQAERAHVLQILVAEKEEAVALLNQIKAGKDFGVLARKHSTAPEAQQGGDMGVIKKEDIPEELERPIFSLKGNEVSGIIESPFGFHIFKVLEKHGAGALTMDDMVEEIRMRVKELKVKDAYGPWLAKLRSKYNVMINEDII
jgi:parvulin-like peptidyl-prolyl isomerase